MQAAVIAAVNLHHVSASFQQPMRHIKFMPLDSIYK